MNLVKESANSSDTIALVVNFISWSTFSVIVSIFLLHMMYRQNYAYIYTFLILCIEFLAFMHTKVCPSCTHDTKRWTHLCQYIAHLLYCGVQVLQRYPRICMNLKEFNIETMPSLSICCTTTLYCKGSTQPPSPLPH